MNSTALPVSRQQILAVPFRELSDPQTHADVRPRASPAGLPEALIGSSLERVAPVDAVPALVCRPTRGEESLRSTEVLAGAALHRLQTREVGRGSGSGGK